MKVRFSASLTEEGAVAPSEVVIGVRKGIAGGIQQLVKLSVGVDCVVVVEDVLEGRMVEGVVAVTCHLVVRPRVVEGGEVGGRIEARQVPEPVQRRVQNPERDVVSRGCLVDAKKRRAKSQRKTTRFRNER